MNGGNRSIAVRRFVPALLLGFAIMVGCGGTEGYSTVTGNVTLDGQPLPDALIQFSPVNPGSPSYGRTDASGNYELIYSREIKGAELGEHVVAITTAQTGDPDAEPPTQDVPEKLPPKYHSQTELKVEVKPGKNVHNFELQSK